MLTLSNGLPLFLAFIHKKSSALPFRAATPPTAGQVTPEPAAARTRSSRLGTAQEASAGMGHNLGAPRGQSGAGPIPRAPGRAVPGGARMAHGPLPRAGCLSRFCGSRCGVARGSPAGGAGPARARGAAGAAPLRRAAARGAHVEGSTRVVLRAHWPARADSAPRAASALRGERRPQNAAPGSRRRRTGPAAAASRAHRPPGADPGRARSAPPAGLWAVSECPRPEPAAASRRATSRPGGAPCSIPRLGDARRVVAGPRQRPPVVFLLPPAILSPALRPAGRARGGAGGAGPRSGRRRRRQWPGPRHEHRDAAGGGAVPGVAGAAAAADRTW